MNARRLSVVIGVASPAHRLDQCLNALAGSEAEIIVVSSLAPGFARTLAAAHPEVKMLSHPELHLVPELWERGVRASTGSLVALLAADCIPAPGWVERIFASHRAGEAGIGGAIENEPAKLADWALYFCRYSRYMLPFAKAPVADFAGDNASYKKAALDLCTQSRARGFWEPEIHAELRHRGMTLTLDPSIVVHLHNAQGVAGFLAQRYHHGRQFGRDRTAKMNVGQRVFRIVSSPLIPLVLLMRVAREVLKRKRHIPQFLASVPLLAAFFLGWTAGEVAGYLTPLKAT